MRTGNHKRTGKNRQNSGFTLIELLVTIGIIAALAGLLLAGITAATQSVATAKASNEVQSLSTALAQFKSEFGYFPPSQIVLHETAAGWNETDTNTVRSLALIRQLWPNFNQPGNIDINGDGSIAPVDAPLMLSGPECLVFFLGGPLRPRPSSTDPFAPLGFSKNPANPFSPEGTNRLGPFHEFILDRLVDTDGDGMPEYLDTYSSQTTPILYLSSYDGRGYRAVEVPPGMTNGVYRQGQEADPTMGQPDDTTAWNSKTYQLISPGIDGSYGTGGWYDPSGPGGISQEDNDNITNFSTGKLK